MSSKRVIVLTIGVALLIAAPLAAQNASQQQQPTERRGLFQVLQGSIRLPTFGLGGDSAASSHQRQHQHSANQGNAATSGSRQGASVGSAPNTARTQTSQAVPSSSATVSRTPATTTPQVETPNGMAPLPQGGAVAAPSTTSSSSSLHQRLNSFEQSVFGDVGAGAGAAQPTRPSPATIPQLSTTPQLSTSPQVSRQPAALTPTPVQESPIRVSPAPVRTAQPISSAPAVPQQQETVGAPSPATPRPLTPNRVISSTPSSSGQLSPVQEPVPTLRSQPTESPAPLQADSGAAQRMDAGASGLVEQTPTMIRSTERPTPLSPRVSAEPSPISQRMEVAASPSTNEPIAIPAAKPSEPNAMISSAPSQGPSAMSSRTPSQETDENVLVVRHSPQLSVQTLGPKHISVGKESVFQVNLANAGEVAAEQVVVSVDLPAWAAVMNMSVTSGATGSSQATEETTKYQWKISRVEAKSNEQLVLRIVPRERKPFDLNVNWTFAQASSSTMIEVQEPNISMELEGPRQVLWGETEVYRLKVKNTGNGDAHNVHLELAPIGGGASERREYVIPLVAAESEQVVELALVAAQTGSVTIDVTASDENNITASLNERIAVLRAALDVRVEAPQLRFVGNQATYMVHVRNTGSATARGVEVSASLPLNVQYVSDVGGGVVAPDQRKVTWRMDEFDQGAERTFSVTVGLLGEGASRLDVLAKAVGDLQAAGEAIVRVESIADLSLAVVDPSGPVAVGEEAEYEVVITNRGTKQAREVEVAAAFDEGITPTTIDGGRHRVSQGMIEFDPLHIISPGEEKRLTIRAKADRPGNHKVRVEVVSAMGTKLSSEETTYYYGGISQPPMTAGVATPFAQEQVAPPTPAPNYSPSATDQGMVPAVTPQSPTSVPMTPNAEIATESTSATNAVSLGNASPAPQHIPLGSPTPSAVENTPIESTPTTAMQPAASGEAVLR